MGVNSATCDWCKKREGITEDYDGQWWCEICDLKENNYNETSLCGLNKRLRIIIKQYAMARKEKQKLEKLIKRTKRKIWKLEAKDEAILEIAKGIAIGEGADKLKEMVEEAKRRFCKWIDDMCDQWEESCKDKPCDSAEITMEENNVEKEV